MDRESVQAMASSPTVTSVIFGEVADSGRSSRSSSRASLRLVRASDSLEPKLEMS